MVSVLFIGLAYFGGLFSIAGMKEVWCQVGSYDNGMVTLTDCDISSWDHSLNEPTTFGASIDYSTRLVYMKELYNYYIEEYLDLDVTEVRVSLYQYSLKAGTVSSDELKVLKDEGFDLKYDADGIGSYEQAVYKMSMEDFDFMPVHCRAKGTIYEADTSTQQTFDEYGTWDGTDSFVCFVDKSIAPKTDRNWDMLQANVHFMLGESSVVTTTTITTTSTTTTTTNIITTTTVLPTTTTTFQPIIKPEPWYQPIINFFRGIWEAFTNLFS